MEGTQEQRIAERRARIQKKLSAQRGLSSDVTAAGASPGTLSKAGEQRAQEARRHMASMHSEAINAVTQFHAKAGVEEKDRRDREVVFSDERKEKRVADAEENEARQGALEMRFESLYTHKIPHQLFTAIGEQREQCGKQLAVKEKLIHELQAQLDDKEEEYVRLLRQNAEDIDGLVKAMRAKSNEYLDHYTRQLEEVEEAYDMDRKEFMSDATTEIQQLVKARRTKETDYRKKRETKITDAQATLEEKHEGSYEDYNDSKRTHLGEIHSLREELEKCKADFMLNGERLSYNLQVLRERVKENKSAQSQYKRKLARLQDTLSTLVARYQESDRKYQRANKDLTAQLHRAGTQYQDLQKKFQLFEKADKDKYRQLWNMHDQKCKRLVHRSLQADRVVFEDILNMPWQPPEMNYWPEEQEDIDGMDDDDEEETPDDLELTEPALMMFHILQMQAPFLVDENVRAAIQRIEGTTEEQASVEGILASLRIKKNHELDDLLEYFMVDGDEETAALINPQEAVRAMNAFLEERKAKEDSDKEKASQSMTKNKQKAHSKQKERRRVAEKSYWKKLAESVPKEHLAVWEALESGIEKYLAQLQQRKALISEADTLRDQNSELKSLLGQYMHSSINYELYVPPTLVMNAHNSASR